MIDQLPASIRVGPYEWAIEIMPPLEATAKGALGECDRIRFAIRVRGDIQVQKLVNTFIHEVYHAIYYTQNIHEGDDEERIVLASANGWTQVYRDNPWLLGWIAQCVDPQNMPHRHISTDASSRLAAVR